MKANKNTDRKVLIILALIVAVLAIINKLTYEPISEPIDPYTACNCILDEDQ